MDGWAGRQAGRQAGKHAGRQAGKQAGIQAGVLAGRQSCRQAARQVHGQTAMQSLKRRQALMYRGSRQLMNVDKKFLCRDTFYGLSAATPPRCLHDPLLPFTSQMCAP